MVRIYPKGLCQAQPLPRASGTKMRGLGKPFRRKNEALGQWWGYVYREAYQMAKEKITCEICGETFKCRTSAIMGHK